MSRQDTLDDFSKKLLEMKVDLFLLKREFESMNTLIASLSRTLEEMNDALEAELQEVCVSPAALISAIFGSPHQKEVNP